MVYYISIDLGDNFRRNNFNSLNKYQLNRNNFNSLNKYQLNRNDEINGPM